MQRTYRPIIFICIVVFGYIVILQVFENKIKQTAEAFSLLPKKEHFTELYFEDPSHLPKLITPDKSQRFSFILHNLENEDSDYKFQVFYIIKDSRISATIPLTNIELVHISKDGYATEEVIYTLNKELAKNGVIFVKLLGTAQEIHFALSQSVL